MPTMFTHLSRHRPDGRRLSWPTYAKAIRQNI
jgi:hypothetical protein